MAFRILADANIPHAERAFEAFGAVERRAGQEIDSDALNGVDALMVRSVTPVNRALLDGTAVRFVGSATIGTDHVDRAFLREAGIAFAHAPGSNAQSVVEYVLAALLAVSAEDDTPLDEWTVGVVGCGHIGGRLVQRLPALGVRVLACDPPLADAAEAEGRAHDFVPPATVLAEADVVTLHPPLTRDGAHPTFHLIGARELAAMKPDALLVNASRGAVVDNRALREALDAGTIGGAVLDVWENEPTPDPDLMRLVRLGTPHIAGYSYDGKVTGTKMLHDALAAFLGVPPTWDAERLLSYSARNLAPLVAPDSKFGETDWLNFLVRQAYSIGADNMRMRDLLSLPEAERGTAFHLLRKTYPRRHAWGHFQLAEHGVLDGLHSAVADGLGFTLRD